MGSSSSNIRVDVASELFVRPPRLRPSFFVLLLRRTRLCAGLCAPIRKP